MNSVLNAKLSKGRNRLDGLQKSNTEILTKVLNLFQTHEILSAKQIGEILNVSREHAQREYVKPLLESGKIKKLETSKGKYQLIESTKTKADLTDEIFSESEVMKTLLFTNWLSNNSSKNEKSKLVRFARICLGSVNPKFKIHPDGITKDNWETVIKHMKDAVLEVSKNKRRLTFMNRQAFRHAIIYGLDINISQEKGKKLGIDGDKDKPKTADLRISSEQIIQAKKLLKKNDLEFVKFGVKCWTFCRPSTLYIIETKDLKFYDRVVKFAEIDGVKVYKKDVIDFVEKLLLVFPQAESKIKIGSYSHRACSLKVFENKTQTDFQKYIYDESFVIPLEKYHKQRLFQKKKYLFWNDNKTEFTFETYDRIVVSSVANDNKFFKKILTSIGFDPSDFGSYFRANYAFRHFGLQMWLELTDYDYEFVSEMSHDDVATLKNWYGKRSSEHLEKRASEVVV